MVEKIKSFSWVLFLVAGFVLLQISCSSDSGSSNESGGDSDFADSFEESDDVYVGSEIDSDSSVDRRYDFEDKDSEIGDVSHSEDDFMPDKDSLPEGESDTDLVPGSGDVTVNPARIDDLLVNPGMGFANFQFGWWYNLPPITYSAEECAERVRNHWPENYPDAGTAYFRWHWNEIEPERGKIDFDMIDMAIQSASALGETFSFRIVVIQNNGIGVPDWHDLGWTADAPDGEVYKTFEWAGEQHASYLNAKFTPVHEDYVEAVDDLLTNKNGYRFVIDSFNHNSVVKSGEGTLFTSTWSNIGVAPSYIKRALIYRLRGDAESSTFKSSEDIRDWLPGSWQVTDIVTIPSNLKAGNYEIEVAILDRAGTDPVTPPLTPIHLGIQGREDDGWYLLSTVAVE